MRRWDERVPHEFGFTQSLFNFYNRPLSEELWDAQVRAIREIADRESCVIVGRNADYTCGSLTTVCGCSSMPTATGVFCTCAS